MLDCVSHNCGKNLQKCDIADLFTLSLHECALKRGDKNRSKNFPVFGTNFTANIDEVMLTEQK
jgi:hypothetical protein